MAEIMAILVDMYFLGDAHFLRNNYGPIRQCPTQDCKESTFIHLGLQLYAMCVLFEEQNFEFC